jgi:hypothetical protein
MSRALAREYDALVEWHALDGRRTSLQFVCDSSRRQSPHASEWSGQPHSYNMHSTRQEHADRAAVQMARGMSLIVHRSNEWRSGVGSTSSWPRAAGPL